MSYNLFLDDIRHYNDTANSAPVHLKPMYRKLVWIIVRSYHEFVAYIEKNGLPTRVSFDHDLALEHYTLEEYWETYEKSKEYQESIEDSYKKKTGKHCAEWLVQYCLDNKLDLPEYYIHSMNPVGADNIKSVLNNYEKLKYL